LTDEETPFAPADSLVQVLLTSPEAGWLSVAPLPGPYALRRMVWPFPKGEIPLTRDQQAPSRAFAKLVEAERRMGRRIELGETCVDLGASPGSWSYVALKRGASVTAVDRSSLRDDLMRNPRLRFIRGDAFAFAPEQPVDWLLCDVIAAPQRSIELTVEWLRRQWAKRFVVTIKFKGRRDYAQLDRLKTELPRLVEEWYLVHLCANKNEVCVFGQKW
jgi:23S rRNA (cytidine2498-2'-O)-methyltransferase